MRLFILLLSIACVIAYAHALAGYGGYSFGKGRPDYIMWGLTVGTLCGAAAMMLWKNWIKEAAPDLLVFDIDGLPANDLSSAVPQPRHWSGFGLPVVIYAGRSQSETERALSQLGWEDFPRENLIGFGDASLRNLDLETLCRDAGAKNPFFFGCSAVDKEAWSACGKGVFVAIGPEMEDDPSPAWNSLHFNTLEEAFSALLP
jgi:hypothetical protein